jgi:hypothetical protein
MAGEGSLLMEPPPVRPAEPVGHVVARLHGDRDEQALDLVEKPVTPRGLNARLLLSIKQDCNSP